MTYRTWLKLHNYMYMVYGFLEMRTWMFVNSCHSRLEKTGTNAVDRMLQYASKYINVNDLIKSKEALTMFCLIMMTCNVDPVQWKCLQVSIIWKVILCSMQGIIQCTKLKHVTSTVSYFLFSKFCNASRLLLKFNCLLRSIYINVLFSHGRV